ncbi:MAG: hypothetical protein ACTHM6_08530 [Tepidisphaeraceae bacterium]
MPTTPCETPDELHAWILRYTGLRIPRQPICAHHQAPFDYVTQAYFEPAKDQIVWAPRGGGKTSLAAVVTLLDLLHKPNCSVRILGGSLEQSLRMWDYLLPHVQTIDEGLIENPRSTARKLRLANQSTAAVLTQSQRSVRGLRVQKIRCDEVELFEEPVWEAAQLATRTSDGTRGTIEALSTLHRPFGLMQKIVDEAVPAGRQLVRWCLLDVIERCPPERDCATCPLWSDCGGLAKERGDGFFRIDDAIAMKARVSEDVWNSEMLCRRPSVRGLVFAMFDPAAHVTATPPFPLDSAGEWWLAMDFGYSAPFVCLWIVRRGDAFYVIDEYLQEQRTLDQHLREVRSRAWPAVTRVACDPAGQGRNEQTAKSNVDLLRASGFVVKTKPSQIVDGIELVRAALKSAAGSIRLHIHPRCAKLIRAMQSYHYATDRSELPDKDGTHDHPIDALRYFFINQQSTRAGLRVY